MRSDDGDIPGIDSALVSALRDPRERLPLFRLEKALVEWMQEGDVEWIEVGGPFNSRIWRQQQLESSPPTDDTRPGTSTSFQRCVLHRLADRFGLIREQGCTSDMIRLIRLPESRVPNELLQDLDPSLYSATESEVKPKPRKMKIMKRNKNSAHVQPANQDGNKNTRPSFSDKEKAYAEARARIFQESESEDPNSRDTTLDNIIQGLSNLTTQETSSLQRELSRNSAGSLNSSTSSNNINSNPNTNSNKNKAVYRNYAEEVADPDFQRSNIPRAANSNLVASAPAFTPGSWRPMDGTNL